MLGMYYYRVRLRGSFPLTQVSLLRGSYQLKWNPFSSEKKQSIGQHRGLASLGWTLGTRKVRGLATQPTISPTFPPRDVLNRKSLSFCWLGVGFLVLAKVYYYRTRKSCWKGNSWLTPWSQYLLKLREGRVGTTHPGISILNCSTPACIRGVL